MPQVFDHIVPGRTADLTVRTVGGQGVGNAHIAYSVFGEASGALGTSNGFAATLKFQEGAVPAVGVNGLTNEVLIAIVLDRLRGFQAGLYPCRENALAITNLEQGLMWLQRRTADRLRRNVEGSYVK